MTLMNNKMSKYFSTNIVGNRYEENVSFLVEFRKLRKCCPGGTVIRSFGDFLAVSSNWTTFKTSKKAPSVHSPLRTRTRLLLWNPREYRKSSPV